MGPNIRFWLFILKLSDGTISNLKLARRRGALKYSNPFILSGVVLIFAAVVGLTFSLWGNSEVLANGIPETSGSVLRFAQLLTGGCALWLVDDPRCHD